MRILGLVNQKGGVGKTTTAVNLAAAIAECGHRTLLVDLDPQGHAAMASGISKRSVEHSVNDVLAGTSDLRRARVYSQTGKFDVLASRSGPPVVGAALRDLNANTLRLKEELLRHTSDYDFVIVDCPPVLSTPTTYALCAADEIIIPLQCEYYALEGLVDLIAVIKRTQATQNQGIKILGILRVMFDARSAMANQVSERALKHFGDKVFTAIIPRDEDLASAPSYGVPGVILDKQSSGALAYEAFAAEVLQRTTVAFRFVP